MPKAAERRTTTKAEATRRNLLDAASRLFAERGYHATSVPDIVREAGVGHGTFYEYFRSRRDILVALTEPVTNRRRSRVRSDSLAERIRGEIHRYLADHVEHVELSKIWHEAMHLDAEIAETRRRERRRRVARVREGIEAANPPGIDPAVAAAALMAMLEEFAQRWFIEGDGPGRTDDDIAAASDTLTRIWLGVLGLDDVIDVR